MIKKILGFLAIAFYSLLLKPSLVVAAERCETQYGGGQICVRTGELQINKEVKRTDSGIFVDNLGINDYKFFPGEEVVFKLRIKNIGNETFSKVEVKDTLPDYLEWVSGGPSFEISDLQPGETEEREIKAKVVLADKFPDQKTTICVVNAAEASSGDEKDKDTAQLCVQKTVLGVTTLPATGPSIWLPIFLLSLVLAGSGIFLIKSAR